MTGWLRYAVQTLLYGFTYQVGQNLADEHGKEDAIKNAGWPLVLMAVLWVIVILALLGEMST